MHRMAPQKTYWCFFLSIWYLPFGCKYNANAVISNVTACKSNFSRRSINAFSYRSLYCIRPRMHFRYLWAAPASRGFIHFSVYRLCVDIRILTAISLQHKLMNSCVESFVLFRTRRVMCFEPNAFSSSRVMRFFCLWPMRIIWLFSCIYIKLLLRRRRNVRLSPYYIFS